MAGIWWTPFPEQPSTWQVIIFWLGFNFGMFSSPPLVQLAAALVAVWHALALATPTPAVTGGAFVSSELHAAVFAGTSAPSGAPGCCFCDLRHSSLSSVNTTLIVKQTVSRHGL